VAGGGTVKYLALIVQTRGDETNYQNGGTTVQVDGTELIASAYIQGVVGNPTLQARQWTIEKTVTKVVAAWANKIIKASVQPQHPPDTIPAGQGTVDDSTVIVGFAIAGTGDDPWPGGIPA
jgi:hypothetical protein